MTVHDQLVCMHIKMTKMNYTLQFSVKEVTQPSTKLFLFAVMFGCRNLHGRLHPGSMLKNEGEYVITVSSTHHSE